MCCLCGDRSGPGGQNAQATTTTTTASAAAALLRKTDLDPCLWLNQHVHTGYRPPNQPAIHYAMSMLEWNNETINIWTHLIGFFYFTWLQYTTNFYVLPAIGASQTDHITVTLCLLGSQICMLLSSFYHTFGAANVRAKRRLLRLDIFGISAAFVSIYLMGIYTAFLCFEEWQTKYYTFLLGISLIAIYVSSREDVIESKAFGSGQIGYLHIIYFLIAAFSICPTVHWIVLQGGFDNDQVVNFLPNLLTLYSMAALALFFHVSMMPERWLPGKFDVLGCSHQWWHLLTLMAMVFWQRSGLDYLTLHRTDTQLCYVSQRPFNGTVIQ